MNRIDWTLYFPGNTLHFDFILLASIPSTPFYFLSNTAKKICLTEFMCSQKLPSSRPFFLSFSIWSSSYCMWQDNIPLFCQTCIWHGTLTRQKGDCGDSSGFVSFIINMSKTGSTFCSSAVGDIYCRCIHSFCTVVVCEACCCLYWIMGFHTATFSLPFHHVQDWSFSFDMYAAVWCTFQLNPAYSANICLSVSTIVVLHPNPWLVIRYHIWVLFSSIYVLFCFVLFFCLGEWRLNALKW